MAASRAVAPGPWRPVEARFRIPLVAAVLVAIWYLASDGAQSVPTTGSAVVVKAAPGVMLASLVLAARHDDQGRRLGFALLLSVLGITVMTMESRYFFLGFFALVFAHVGFALAFLTDERGLQVVRMVPFLLWMLAVRASVPSYSYFIDGPLTVYLLVTGLMLWRAAARVGRRGPPTVAEWVTLAGAILFGIGDTVLTLDRFLIDNARTARTVMLLFWAGQFAFVRAALDESQPPPRRRPAVNPGTIPAIPPSRRPS
jgi:alkenylglycerophosphocholine hydrolase